MSLRQGAVEPCGEKRLPVPYALFNLRVEHAPAPCRSRLLAAAGSYRDLRRGRESWRGGVESRANSAWFVPEKDHQCSQGEGSAHQVTSLNCHCQGHFRNLV